MRRFPSAKRLASWAGVCPGNKQSGGKRLSGHTTSGNGWLRAVLGEVAWAISHTSGNYLSAQFHRLARRRGKQKAVLAVAHSVLVILYHLLRDHQPSADLGADYFEQLDRTHLERRYVHQLERLGYVVALTPSVACLHPQQKHFRGNLDPHVSELLRTLANRTNAHLRGSPDLATLSERR
jgi:transposase